MSFENVFLTDDALSKPHEADVVALQQRLQIPLPVGYREYITTLGEGNYCNNVTVLPPDAIRCGNEIVDWRELFWEDTSGRHFYWEPGRDVLSYNEVLESNCFAVTDDGDYIVQHAKNPERPFVLPRFSDTVFWLEQGFFEPLEWCSQTGIVRQTPQTEFFTPKSNDYRHIELFCKDPIDLGTTIATATTRWPEADQRFLEEAGSCLIMVSKTIGGNVQITYSNDDPRIGIRIAYLGKFQKEVEQLETELKGLGYFETGRYPVASRTP